jgi:hypothetical protein
MPVTRSLRRAVTGTGGYTIDQTILIVAIIAILVTLIIISVGWQLINRTSGTKLAAQFKQVEDANGQFYSSFRVWPDESYSDSPSDDLNMMALTGAGVTFRDTVPSTQTRNFIPGFRIDGSHITHNFSSSGNYITMHRVTNPFGLQGSYLVVEFTQVPFSEVEEAERSIDAGPNGTMDFASGRVVALTTGDCVTGTVTSAAVEGTTPAGNLVNVCYAANLTQ